MEVLAHAAVGKRLTNLDRQPEVEVVPRLPHAKAFRDLGDPMPPQNLLDALREEDRPPGLPRLRGPEHRPFPRLLNGRDDPDHPAFEIDLAPPQRSKFAFAG